MYGTGAAVSSRLPIEVRMDMAKFNKELADSRASVEKGFYTPPKTNYPAGFDTIERQEVEDDLIEKKNYLNQVDQYKRGGAMPIDETGRNYGYRDINSNVKSGGFTSASKLMNVQTTMTRPELGNVPTEQMGGQYEFAPPPVSFEEINGKTNPYATGGATPPAPGGALERSLGYYKGLDVTPEMEQEMLNKYQGSLTAKLQAAAGNLANPMSGQSNKDVMDMYGTGAAVSSRLPIEVRMDMAKFNKELADSRASVEKGFYTPPKTNYPAGFDTNAMNQLANLQMQNSIANEVSNPTPTVPLVSGGSLSAITNKMTGKNISDMKKRLRGY